MTIASRIYDFSLTAGGSFHLLVQGDYLRIMDSTGQLEVITDNYRIGPIMAGQGQAKSPYTRVTLVDKSGNPNIGHVLIAGSDFIDNRINGEVSVIDGEKSRTLAGGMFSGTAISLNTAGQYNFTQLWNPVASEKNLIVTQLSFSSGAAATVDWYLKNSALTNNQSASRIQNKYAGKLLGVAEVRSMEQVGVEAFPNGRLRTLVVGATLEAQWPVKGAIVVPPGWGLTCTAENVQLTLISNFEWFEESIA